MKRLRHGQPKKTLLSPLPSFFSKLPGINHQRLNITEICCKIYRMNARFKENETLELKRSTLELREGIKSIVAILNKHGFGELYFGIKNDGTVVGQGISEKTIRDISQSISENIEPKIYPEINVVK